MDAYRQLIWTCIPVCVMADIQSQLQARALSIRAEFGSANAYLECPQYDAMSL